MDKKEENNMKKDENLENIEHTLNNDIINNEKKSKYISFINI